MRAFLLLVVVTLGSIGIGVAVESTAQNGSVPAVQRIDELATKLATTEGLVSPLHIYLTQSKAILAFEFVTNNGPCVNPAPQHFAELSYVVVVTSNRPFGKALRCWGPAPERRAIALAIDIDSQDLLPVAYWPSGDALLPKLAHLGRVTELIPIAQTTALPVVYVGGPNPPPCYQAEKEGGKYLNIKESCYQVRPTNIAIDEDGNDFLSDLTWSRWATISATGTGLQTVRCFGLPSKLGEDPDCGVYRCSRAAGCSPSRFSYNTPARIRLSEPVPTGMGSVFTSLRITSTHPDTVCMRSGSC